MRKPNTVGGGARTNLNGLHFEQTTELRDLFEDSERFTVLGDDIYENDARRCAFSAQDKDPFYHREKISTQCWKR